MSGRLADPDERWRILRLAVGWLSFITSNAETIELLCSNLSLGRFFEDRVSFGEQPFVIVQFALQLGI
jgi:hypothetical protein